MSRAFHPSEPLGDGRTVIEASAGTGKTFTIAAAVTRLVAEEKVDIEQILVVTFTRAATAELKKRVRRRIVHTLAAVEGRRSAADEHMKVLTEVAPDRRATYARRLREALTRFDRAQIFTIHGFAQRLLSVLGFRVRLSAELEPGSVDDLLIKAVATDLIVDRFVVNPDDAEVLQADTATAIAHTVVDTPDALIVPATDDVSGLARIRVEMAYEMGREVNRRMRISGARTFDSGLIEVRDALTDAEIGDAARELLRQRYIVGLVDESQDTDPIQWEVIRAVFDEARLVMIGDPKQSIYSFRGADVEAYLAAAAGADTRRTLVTNWRSDGPLIQALDVLFEGVTFGDDRIEYQRVEPAPGHEQARLHGPGSPLSIRRFHPDFPIRRRRNGYFLVNPAREAVAGDAADQVVGLLTSGVEVDHESQTMPLGPSDIGVLCRTRKQVDLVRAELTRRQVPSVAARTGGVFTSPAAEDWRRFLLAVERPDRMDHVRLAATTRLVGLSLVEVASLSDERALDLQQQAREWQRLLHDNGVPALVAELNRVTGLAARVLASPDGERMMTDLTHISEEMHAVWRRGRIGSLVGWLEANMAEAREREMRNIEEAESRQRRLETDAEAVQVQTVHGAKGLQYPVVLVPYAWDVPPMSPDIPIFHEAEAAAGDVPRRRLVDVAGPGWEGFDDHVALAGSEEAAEEGRLLYVALTRAQHRLVVWWIEDAATCADSKLTELISRDGRRPEDLATLAGGTIEMPMVTEPPPVRYYQPEAPNGETLDRSRFSRPLDHRWQRASFSSLSAAHPVARPADTTEGSWRDDELEGDGEVPVAPAGSLPMADLPAGARFGTLVHRILEQVPFDAPDLLDALRRVTATEIRAGGWDFDPETLVTGLLASLETPLGPDPGALSLRELDSARLFDELLFEFPVRTEQGVVALGDIGEVMLQHLSLSDPYRAYAEHLKDLDTPPFRGYLAGAIDLTGVIPGPTGDSYVVMDYKSNTLPATSSVPGHLDYGPDPLATAMMEGHYVLQATLYQVALHRYLQWRLPGYDPATHLGGSMYLFIRGMTGSDTPLVDGERCGVARWHPPADMVVGLSRLFSGRGS